MCLGPEGWSAKGKPFGQLSTVQTASTTRRSFVFSFHLKVHRKAELPKGHVCVKSILQKHFSLGRTYFVEKRKRSRLHRVSATPIVTVTWSRLPSPNHRTTTDYPEQTALCAHHGDGSQPSHNACYHASKSKIQSWPQNIKRTPPASQPVSTSFFPAKQLH